MEEINEKKLFEKSTNQSLHSQRDQNRIPFPSMKIKKNLSVNQCKDKQDDYEKYQIDLMRKYSSPEKFDYKRSNKKMMSKLSQ